jgi:hypothetical protein
MIYHILVGLNFKTVNHAGSAKNAGGFIDDK